MAYRQEFVPNEIYLNHQGVTIYRTYSDGNIEDPMYYWFTLTDDSHGDAEEHEFDVRSLPDWPNQQHPDEDELIPRVLKSAIEAGLLKNPDPS